MTLMLILHLRLIVHTPAFRQFSFGRRTIVPILWMDAAEVEQGEAIPVDKDTRR